MGPRLARALGWVSFGLVLLAGPAAAADFAAILKQSLANRSFGQGRDTTDPAAKPMFDRLLRGDYSLPALTRLPDLARLDRAVGERCAAAQAPSQLIKDSTPFLMTGQFEAKTVPPGARITTSDIGSPPPRRPSGRLPRHR